MSALIREGVLRQNAYHPNDAISSPEKTFALAAAALALLRAGEAALAAGAPFSSLDLLPVRRALVMLRDAADADVPARTAEVMRLTKEIAPPAAAGEVVPPAAPKEAAA